MIYNYTVFIQKTISFLDGGAVSLQEKTMSPFPWCSRSGDCCPVF